jgi:hypothetical protein
VQRAGEQKSTQSGKEITSREKNMNGRIKEAGMHGVKLDT